MYAITLSTIALLTHNTTPITIRTILAMHQATITTKIIAVQTQILEDAADIEDNMVSILKAYSTKCTIGFCRILSEDKKNIKIVPITKFGYLCPTNR